MHLISKGFLTGLLFLTAVSAQQKVYWAEGFESATWPSSAPSSETSITVETGAWKINKVNRSTSKFHEGTASLYTSSGGYIITPVVSGGVKEISFFSVSSGTARTITVDISKDGSTFTNHGQTSSGSSSGWAQSTYAIGDTSVKAVRLTFSGGTANIDDITLVSMITPTIRASVESLNDFGAVISGGNSASSIISVSGTDLSANVTVSASAGFQVSTDNSSFSENVTLTVATGALAATTVHVRFSPQTATGTTIGKLTLASTGATSVNVKVSGAAIGGEPAGSSTVSAGSITGTKATLSIAGGSGTGRVVVVRAGSAVNWVPVDGVLPDGINAEFTAAVDQGSGCRAVFAGEGTSVTVTNLSVGTQYFAVVYEYNGTAPGAQNYRTVSPGTVSFTTLEEPGITVDPSNVAFGNVVQGVTSPEKTISVTAKYLSPASGNLTVTTPAGYEISRTSGSGFASSVTIPYTGSSLTSTPLYVHFTPSAKTAFNSTLTVNGGGAPEKSIAVSGTGIDSAYLFIKVYYVDSTGNDENPGTIDKPFYSVAKAVSLAKAGDTIYCRGGTYFYSTTVPLSQSGTSDSWRINLLNYPGEHPIFNFKNQPYNADNRAFMLTGSYWYIRGVEICYGGDNGIKVEGNHNTIERCVLHHNGDTGIQLGFGHYFIDSHPGISTNDGSYCAYNYILNCDSYENYDPPSGGDADGFACKMHNGIGNVFRGCRAWTNSDDGWDLFETDFSVVMDSCWTWTNGTHGGNGNGFKLGGNKPHDSYGVHVVSNCVSFKNKTNNFTNNSHKDGIRVTNCLAFECGSSAYNFFFEGSHNVERGDTFYNTVSISTKGGLDTSLAHDDKRDGAFVQDNNSWNLGVAISTGEFVNISAAAAMALRRADGSLPRGFAQLKQGSVFIDKGKDLGEKYVGNGPDIGPFEFGLITNVKEFAEKHNSGFNLRTASVIANSTTLNFTLAETGLTTLKIFNASGREITTLVNSIKIAGDHTLQFTTSSLSTGTYYAVLKNGNRYQALKLVIAR